MLNPVILFIDNDSGAKSIFKIMSSLFNVTAEINTDLPFYHLYENLYVVKTPKGPAGAEETYIENFFPIEVLQNPIGGKIFNIKKDHESPTEYGKVWLAEKIVKPNADKIDFSGFKPMLERIITVIDHYETEKAKNESKQKNPQGKKK